MITWRPLKVTQNRDIESLKKKFKGSHDIARNEQSSVAEANIETLERLSIGNAEYEKKFGFIFIVFASGKVLKKC